MSALVTSLSAKEEAECVVLNVQTPMDDDDGCWDQPVIREWVHQRIFLQHGQIVMQLKESKKKGKQLGQNDDDENVDHVDVDNTATRADLTTILPRLDLRKKTSKVLVVTPGALLLGPTKRKGLKGLLAMSTTRLVLPWHAIQKLQGMVVNQPQERLVALWSTQEVFQEEDKKNSPSDRIPRNWPTLLYQSPQLQLALLHSLARAYLGVPPWAIPCRVQGFGPTKNQKQQPLLTHLPSCDVDGGLSYRFQACVWARLLSQQLLPDHSKQSDSLGSIPILQSILDLLQAQQPSDHPFRDQLFQTLNCRQLVEGLLQQLEPPQHDKSRAAQKTLQHWKKHQRSLRQQLELDLVDCLPFNLVVRTIQLHRLQMPAHQKKPLNADNRANATTSPSPSISLARLLLYNVTLRHLDLSHTRQLDGKVLGDALSRNAQPLLSTLILDDCDLTTDDVQDGWSLGLARVWGAGGTAHPICFSAANNPKVSVAAWDALWQALLAERDGVPPAQLQFWQKLNLQSTSAVQSRSGALVSLIGRLTGLMHLEWGFDPNSEPQDPRKLLLALGQSPAPLKTIVAKALKEVNSGVHPHAKTLQLLNLEDFCGDAGSIVNGWPIPVPKLTVRFHGYLSAATCSPYFAAHCPGRICISQKGFWAEQVLQALARNSTGLHTLELEHVEYSLLSQTGAIATLAMGGSLKKLLVKNPPADLTGTQANKKAFWMTLAQSKTIEELDVRDQLQAGDLQLVGQFLKKNRSLRIFYFDSCHLVLGVEEVKVLRSAFYGNKKVVQMPYPQKAHKKTMDTIGKETQKCNRNVLNAKSSIKHIFKQHYSKYNPRWRDRPNQLKLPYVEKIRVNKRKIGKMNRNSAKIGELFRMIREAVSQNGRDYQRQKEEKAMVRLEKRTPQLKNVAQKRTKALRTLVTKFHRIKQKAAKKKSAKEQIPRSAYYRRKGAWPFKGAGSKATSHYHRYNDPYYSRRYGNDPYYYYYYGNDDHYYHSRREEEDQQEDNGEATLLPPVSDYICPDTTVTIDSLECNLESGLSSPSFMEELHLQLAEHGEDTMTELSPVLDTLSTIPETTENIAEGVGASPENVTAFMSSVDSNPVSISELQDNLPDIDGGGGFDADEDKVDIDESTEADEAVNMYAGAGPRDLDDGGGLSRNRRTDPVLAGARRRARTRKINRNTIRSRNKSFIQRCQGYHSLDLVSKDENHEQQPGTEDDWPGCLKSHWINEATSVQIEAIRQSGLQGVPDVTEFEPNIFCVWMKTQDRIQQDSSSMEVCLVTQCSLDRLNNLSAQLIAWNGKSSVALYLKKRECAQDARDGLKTMFEKLPIDVRAKTAIAMVEGVSDDAYPINYLRNVALLQARTQLKASEAVDYSSTAVFLVDVDFVPSQNLRETLVHACARDVIIRQRRVVVVPAFEDLEPNGLLPCTCEELRKRVECRSAEPFHITNFQPGHGPTRFDKYWSVSEDTTLTSADIWSKTYNVTYKKLYEPYVVMATEDVPLYDERFQGYGLNKVSHLASVAHSIQQDLLVLPGVFVVAPRHEKSEAYKAIYGKDSSPSSNSHPAETDYAKLHLKGLYQDFLLSDYRPVVSEKTSLWQQNLSLMITVATGEGQHAIAS